MSQERTRQVIEDDPHDHDRGLDFDMGTLMSRRTALGLFAFSGMAALVGCASSSSGSSATTTSAATTTATTTATDASVSEVPEETAGPYPGDGSNGVNVLTQSGIVRSDITSSFGDASGVAEGVPLTIAMTVLDVQAGGTPVKGAAVYVWHCDREGRYSLYSEGATDQNYLRGVQETDAGGRVAFRSIFPACYPGRWPHIHFEVYPSLAEATAAGSKLVTSQIALPEDACQKVYATSGYEESVSNLSQVALATDMVFSDGYSTQLGKVSGPVRKGLTAGLNVGV